MEISGRFNHYNGKSLNSHDRVINGVMFRFITYSHGVVEVIRFTHLYYPGGGGYTVHLFNR